MYQLGYEIRAPLEILIKSHTIKAGGIGATKLSLNPSRRLRIFGLFFAYPTSFHPENCHPSRYHTVTLDTPTATSG